MTHHEPAPSGIDKKKDAEGREARVLSSGEIVYCYGDDIDGCTFWESQQGIDMLGVLTGKNTIGAASDLYLIGMILVKKVGSIGFWLIEKY
jgi:hypothetical protein